MTVFVDDMNLTPLGRYGRMRMSHMIADTPEELLAMADRIGLDRRWLQKPGTAFEHFDIGRGLRRKAVAAGAVEITMRELARKCRARVSPQTPEKRPASAIPPLSGHTDPADPATPLGGRFLGLAEGGE